MKIWSALKKKEIFINYSLKKKVHNAKQKYTMASVVNQLAVQIHEMAGMITIFSITAMLQLQYIIYDEYLNSPSSLLMIAAKDIRFIAECYQAAANPNPFHLGIIKQFKDSMTVCGA